MKKNRNIQKISTFNCKGLLSSTKQRLLANDFEKYKTAAMCILETHMERYGVIIYNQVMETTTYYNSGHKTKSVPQELGGCKGLRICNWTLSNTGVIFTFRILLISVVSGYNLYQGGCLYLAHRELIRLRANIIIISVLFIQNEININNYMRIWTHAYLR